MDGLTLEIVEGEADELADRILDRLDAVPLPPGVAPYRLVPLIIVLRDENGRIEGGLTGHSVWDWFYVRHLWVAEPRRGKGLGTRLMNAAEEEARKRGCEGMWLNTYSFQAPEFYERLGYQRFAEIDDYPKGHRRLSYKKALGYRSQRLAASEEAGGNL